jgi:hypothetical protein
MLTFPRGILPVSRVGWRITTPSQDALTNLAGQPQQLFPSGGGCWFLTLDDIFGRGRDGRLALRALEAALQNGANPIIISPCDCRQAPLGAGQSFGEEPHTDGSPFDDFIAGEGNPITVTFGASAALRATTVRLTQTAGGTITEGMQFSVDHATWGRRMYRLIRDNADSPHTWKIRPPLREAVTNGTAVDFNRPGCVMRLAGNFAIEQTVRGRLDTAKASFVELERPVA